MIRAIYERNPPCVRGSYSISIYTGTHDPLVLHASGQTRLDQTGLFPPNGVVPVTGRLR